MQKEADKLKCKNCKYKTNIANTSELTCSDCSRLHEDMACFSCAEDDSAIFNGQLCRGFIDKRRIE